MTKEQLKKWADELDFVHKNVMKTEYEKLSHNESDNISSAMNILDTTVRGMYEEYYRMLAKETS